MRTFIIILKSDTGTHNLSITATSEEAVRKMVCAAEGCPESAILAVK